MNILPMNIQSNLSDQWLDIIVFSDVIWCMKITKFSSTKSVFVLRAKLTHSRFTKFSSDLLWGIVPSNKKTQTLSPNIFTLSCIQTKTSWLMRRTSLDGTQKGPTAAYNTTAYSWGYYEFWKKQQQKKTKKKTTTKNTHIHTIKEKGADSCVDCYINFQLSVQSFIKL